MSLFVSLTPLVLIGIITLGIITLGIEYTLYKLYEDITPILQKSGLQHKNTTYVFTIYASSI
jgi:hypothetical protein